MKFHKSSSPTHIHAIFIAPKSCHNHYKQHLLSEIHRNSSTVYRPTSSDLTITCKDSLHEKRFYFILIASIPADDSASSIQEYILARDWLYDRKITSRDRTASEMATNVTADLCSEWRSGVFVDENMRDQLVIFRALARGRSEVFPGREVGGEGDGEPREPSLHARTAEWVAKEVLGV